MFFYLSWLAEKGFPSLNVLNYITFRTFMAVLTSFFISLFLYPKFIRHLKKIKAEQSIRIDGPSTHLAKVGTPSFGGILIIGSLLLNVLLWSDFIFNPYVFVMTLLIILFGLIGFSDDYLKMTKKNSKGLSGKKKLFFQLLFSGIFMTVLYARGDYSTLLMVPIFKNAAFDIGIFYIPFGMLVITATSNALNLTDGIDGLAIVPTIVSTALLGTLLYLVGHSALANYLHLFYIADAGELSVVAGAVIGASLAFLWYNAHPAEIFMGDTGSLTLGAIIGAFTIITKTEFLSIVFNGIFVAEALSVIFQVGSFKLTGKRIFRMAPLHHHFEVGGLKETKVAMRFWIVAILLAIISIAMVKVR